MSKKQVRMAGLNLYVRDLQKSDGNKRVLYPVYEGEIVNLHGEQVFVAIVDNDEQPSLLREDQNE